MTLEEAIKQKHFPDQIEKAVVNVLYTSGYIYSNHQQNLKAFGISPEQYNVLRILRGSHPKKLSLLEISGRMLDKSSNATRLVEKLRLKEMVTRKICKVDRRHVDIGITENGLSILLKVDAESKAWFQKLIHLESEEARTLNDLLDKMRG